MTEKKQKKETKEHILHGLGVSGGIAIGVAHIMDFGPLHVQEYALEPESIDAEIARFHQAIKATQRHLKQLLKKAQEMTDSTMRDEVAYLLEAHLAMLDQSRLIRGVENRIRKVHINTEAAIQLELKKIITEFQMIEDTYLASRYKDVEDVAKRLLRHLTKGTSSLPRGLKKNGKPIILIADELSPADIAILDPRYVTGFATVLGGAEGHTAIMARSLSMPAVFGISDLLQQVTSDDSLILDGKTGGVIINPNQETLAYYQTLRDELAHNREKLISLRALPAETKDNIPIRLQANIDLPWETSLAFQNGAEGVGLVRTEFLYMNRQDLPSEEEQLQHYRTIIKDMQGKPVTLRTLDIGGEKLATSLQSYITEPTNPALGLRAIRLSLKLETILETQLTAMVKAATEGPIQILLPMVSHITETQAVKRILHRITQELFDKGYYPSKQPPPLGAMVEIPGAALSADFFATEVDFFAIGSNDLTMYTLAIDRADEQVAYLYNPLHPAVLRLIQFATEAGRRANIPVCLCGEIAGDARYTALLMGLGLKDLSMSGHNIPLVKQRIRALHYPHVILLAQKIMAESDPAIILEILEEFNQSFFV